MTEKTRTNLLDQLESATHNIIRLASTISLKWNRPAEEIFFNDFSGFKSWITDHHEDPTDVLAAELPVHKCMDIMWLYSLMKRDLEKRRIIAQTLEIDCAPLSQRQCHEELMWPKPYAQKFSKKVA